MMNVDPTPSSLSEHRIHRRAQFMAHVGEERVLDFERFHRPGLRVQRPLLGSLALGDIGSNGYVAFWLTL